MGEPTAELRAIAERISDVGFDSDSLAGAIARALADATEEATRRAERAEAALVEAYSALDRELRDAMTPSPLLAELTRLRALEQAVRGLADEVVVILNPAISNEQWRRAKEAIAAIRALPVVEPAAPSSPAMHPVRVNPSGSLECTVCGERQYEGSVLAFTGEHRHG